MVGFELPLFAGVNACDAFHLDYIALDTLHFIIFRGLLKIPRFCPTAFRLFGDATSGA